MPCMCNPLFVTVSFCELQTIIIVWLERNFWIFTVTKQYFILIKCLSSKNSHKQQLVRRWVFLQKNTSWLVSRNSWETLFFTDTISQTILSILKNRISVFVETCFIVYNITNLQAYILLIHFLFIIIYKIQWSNCNTVQGAYNTYCCKPQDNILKS